MLPLQIVRGNVVTNKIAIDKWEKYDNLATHYLFDTRYEAEPESSATVERQLSADGKIFRPTRSYLSHEIFEKLLFLMDTISFISILPEKVPYPIKYRILFKNYRETNLKKVK